MRTPWLVTIVVAAHCIAATCMVLLPGCGTAPKDVPGEEPTVVMPPTEPAEPVRPEPTPPLTPPKVSEWPPETTTYVVKKGDTLSGIAQRFNLTVTEISAVNGIDNPNQIAVGQKLTLPGQLDVGAPAPKPAPAPSAKPSGNVYEVKKGDSLSEIALRFGTTVKAIKSVNGLTSDKILVGQKLVLPSGSAAPAADQPAPGKPAAKPAPKPAEKPAEPEAADDLDLGTAPVTTPAVEQAATPAPTPPAEKQESAVPGKFRIHVVEADEDLYSIAMMWNVSAAKIREINELSDSEVKAGQRLKIPLSD